MIGVIFSQAKRVLVWLGEHADCSELVFRDDGDQHSYNPVHHLSNVAENKVRKRPWQRFRTPESVSLSGPHCCELLSEQEERSRMDAWAHLLRRPYWWRLWVVQEVVKAKSVLVHCGDRLRDWNTLVTVNMSAKIHSQGGYFDGVATEAGTRYLFARLLTTTLSPFDDLMWERHSDNDLSDHLIENMQRFCLERKCEDRRDKVYALLSISRISAVLEPDYALSMPELFLRVYVSHYMDDLLYSSQESVLAHKELFGFDSPAFTHTFGAVRRLSRAMDLSGPELCTVIDMLFTNPLSHPPGSSDASYAAPVLVAVQFHIQHDLNPSIQVTYGERLKRAYDEVMFLIQSGARAAATETARRLRAVEGW